MYENKQQLLCHIIGNLYSRPELFKNKEVIQALDQYLDKRQLTPNKHGSLLLEACNHNEELAEKILHMCNSQTNKERNYVS